MYIRYVPMVAAGDPWEPSMEKLRIFLRGPPRRVRLFAADIARGVPSHETIKNRLMRLFHLVF